MFLLIKKNFKPTFSLELKPPPPFSPLAYKVKKVKSVFSMVLTYHSNLILLVTTA